MSALDDIAKAAKFAEPLVDGLKAIAAIAAPALDGPLAAISGIIAALEAGAAGTITIAEAEARISAAHAEHNAKMAAARDKLDANFPDPAPAA